MNWQAVSFDWNQVRAFYVAVEEGSLSGAARVLNSSQPTIGRQISALEESLGITLVERSVKGLQITQEGRDLVEYVQAMSEAASMISIVADSRSQEVSGPVAITATDLLSTNVLPQILLELRETAPGIRIRVNASNDIQDLMHREADIAIRHVRPEQPELIAKHVGDFRANLYASTTYLDATGRPRTLRDIAGYDFVGNADLDRMIIPLQKLGVPVRPENFVASSESGTVIWAMLKAGYGIAMQPERLGDADPDLEKVSEALPSLHFPMWLVTHRELRTSPRIRIVFDLLARGLSEAAREAGASGGSESPRPTVQKRIAPIY
jgi:DNA-binding transcriptional LysR family regulator